MIVYLHGFNSAPASHKAQELRRHLEGLGFADRFRCPQLPHWPADAVEMIDAEIRACDETPTLVGSSLGGFYATHFAERCGLRAVLINPAIAPHLGLRSYLGVQQNLYTAERYVLTTGHLEAWGRLLVEHVDPERYLLLLETGDELLDWRVAARRYEGARTVIRDGGDHTLQSFAEHLPRILDFAGFRAQR